MDAAALKALQAPLKDKYRETPQAAVVTLKAEGRIGEGVTCRVETGKALVVYEDAESWGYGAEIAARIADKLFEHLDGPVRRVAALDTFVAYAPELEDEILPQVDDIAAGIVGLARY